MMRVKHLLGLLLLLSACAMEPNSQYWVTTRTQMEALQVMLETYAVDHETYPPHIEALKQVAQEPSVYWKELSNPCSQIWPWLDYKAVLTPQEKPQPCALVYDVAADLKSYQIRAYNWELAPFRLTPYASNKVPYTLSGQWQD